MRVETEFQTLKTDNFKAMKFGIIKHLFVFFNLEEF